MKTHIRTLRIGFFISLLFFLCIRCQPSNESPAVNIISKNDKAVGLVIRGIKVEERNLSNRIKIRRTRPADETSVLGQFKLEGEEIIFEPVVPFTPGLHYEVLLDTSLLAKIEIPKGNFLAPELISIYPTQDTVPENLLKVYLEFSRPMVEGRSLLNLTLIGNDGDTLKGTFLDLQPELWNAESTVLTLWLDPGRIKRDLIPNTKLGAPLQAKQKYTLHVSDLWRSKEGLPLLKSYSKTFVTTSRDEASPDPLHWRIGAPPSESRRPLTIQLQEPLDYYILTDALTVFDEKETRIKGVWRIAEEEKTISFLPDKPWNTGKFTISIESRLEDLSGNNLNRPFDRNVEEKKQTQDKDYFLKKFEIQ